jgi:hypothetical protein
VGLARHLAGARVHLVGAMEGAADPAGLDLPALIVEIDRRLEMLESLADRPAASVPALRLEHG